MKKFKLKGKKLKDKRTFDEIIREIEMCLSGECNHVNHSNWGQKKN